MKCQKCSKPALVHITEILSDEQFELHHFCEECAQRYIQEPQAEAGSKTSAQGGVEEQDELGNLSQKECSVCGIKFVEFRNSGRLGCPHDYEEFHEELLPLLENIHGESRHVGKTPRRLPKTKQSQNEMIQLRKQLQQAISREAYEEAAKIRDRIRKMEA